MDRPVVAGPQVDRGLEGGVVGEASGTGSDGHGGGIRWDMRARRWGGGRRALVGVITGGQCRRWWIGYPAEARTLRWCNGSSSTR